MHERVCGLVLAAGGSSRLGRPKQLLSYRGTTLLDAVLNTARACGFDQLVVALGGSAESVRSEVELSGADVVVNDAFGEGCSATSRGSRRRACANCSPAAATRRSRCAATTTVAGIRSRSGAPCSATSRA